MIIFEDQEILVRKIDIRDEQILVTWLTDPRVLEFYEGRDCPQDLELVRKHYYNVEPVIRCIVEYNHEPIGFIQYYLIDETEQTEYGYHNLGEKIYGMDQFIGETNFWNQGIGSKLVSSMIQYLIKQEDADRIIMDPQTWNKRALACYTKCGFKIVKLLEQHEKHEGKMRDCYLMEYSLE